MTNSQKSYSLLPVAEVPDRVPSNVGRGWAFLEDANRRGFPDFETFIDAVPVGRIGPVMFMAHCEPEYPFSKYYDLNLVVPCSLSKENYAKVKESLIADREFIASCFDDVNAPEREAIPVEWLDPDLITDEEEATRNIVKWLLKSPGLHGGGVGAVRTSLERITPIKDSLNSDWRLILSYIQNRHLIGTIDVVGGRLPNSGDYGLEPKNADNFKVVPFYEDDDFLYLLCSDIEDTRVDDFLTPITDKQVIKCLTSASSIEAGNKVEVSQAEEIEYDNNESYKDAAFSVIGDNFSDFEPLNPEIERMTLVQWLMLQASVQGASDVHIDVFQGSCRVRFSIDGELEVFINFPRNYLDGISSSIKQIAKIDAGSIAHCEGGFSYIVNNKLFDTRLGLLMAGRKNNAYPKIVMRLLDRTRGVMDLNELGLDYDDLTILKNAYSRRHGLILASGGTGHGKSTTLAAIVKALNSSNRACYTLEDPIETTIDGVAQITASSKAVDGKKGSGLPFHQGLERLLRMDPDVIVVGEIRDPKTAEVTPKAALTGHLVLSTVHTNDAVTVISRMLGFGVDPFELAQSLALSSSQVLIRKLCNCSSTVKLKPRQKELFESSGIPVTSGFVAVPQGCSACNYRGYKGRRVIMEFMEITPAIKDAIMEQRNPSEIRRIAISEGYKSIFQKGLELVLAGETSLEEVMKHGGYTYKSQSKSISGDGPLSLREGALS